jgi:hypothetical protein
MRGYTIKSSNTIWNGQNKWKCIGWVECEFDSDFDICQNVKVNFFCQAVYWLEISYLKGISWIIEVRISVPTYIMQCICQLS